MFVGPEAYCFTSGRGVGHVEQMLEILASVQMCREKNFERPGASGLDSRRGIERLRLRFPFLGRRPPAPGPGLVGAPGSLARPGRHRRPPTPCQPE